MCLAIPCKIVEVFEDHGLRMGRIDFAGTIRKACLAQVPEAGLGDYVLVHVGFALSVVDAEEAERTYALLEELGLLGELEAPEAPG
jgi:hydrogenase expression/formation protein HypC